MNTSDKGNKHHQEVTTSLNLCTCTPVPVNLEKMTQQEKHCPESERPYGDPELCSKLLAIVTARISVVMGGHTLLTAIETLC